MNISSGTDKGLVRSVNEDSYCVCNDKVTYMAVADGMGGHKAGSEASRCAVETVQSALTLEKINSSKSIVETLTKCVERANSFIYKKSLTDDDLSGMGTTLVVFYADENKGYIVNVGDSRAYLIRNGEIRQITRDHSVVQELFESGKIKLEDMRTHPNKNLITRAVGTKETVIADVFELDLQKEDLVLLCSDGLTNMLDDKQILDIYENSSDLDTFVSVLIEKANDAGGRDNITVTAAKL